MFYTAGIWLIYAGVALRVLVRYDGVPQRGLVALLLGAYGLLLLIQSAFGRHRSFERPDPSPVQAAEPSRNRRWPVAVYLAVQTGILVALFSIPPHVDLFAGLFIPLCLQAVVSFGRRPGFLCLAVFPLVMLGALTANGREWPFSLAMSSFTAGLLFLFGSYADQVQKAEQARDHNQRLLGDLQAATHRLQGYAAQVEGLAAERERSRLARELHDSVTQTVFSMNLTVQSARLLLERDRGRTAGQLGRLEELAAGAMGEIQTLVAQLRPAPLTEPGLPAALRQLAVERQSRDGLQITLEISGQRDLGEAAVSGLYRIAQEALTNVARHAGTHEATVRLDLETRRARLEIEDLGRGFDPRAARGKEGHLGLASMAERASEIGWELTIDSRPGAGTLLRVEERQQGERR